jgi:hypothetical protein
MALRGRAIVAVWNDITLPGRDNFIEWHNREHIPERVGIPGFLRGRRYIAEYGTPTFFTLYEAVGQGVLIGNDYLQRLNNPTPWTKQATAEFRNTLRGVCAVRFSQGSGDGGVMLTLRFDPEGGNESRLERAIREELPKIGALKGVTGTHLCIADSAASGIETAERKGRQVGVPNWIIMVEGSSVAAVDAAGKALSASLAEFEKIGQVETGLYRLEYSLADYDE